MKRISIFLVILAMAVTLGGCGGKEAETATHERERSRSTQEESDSKDKEEEIVADGETAVILYYVLNYAHLYMLDDLSSPLTTDILEKYWDKKIIFYDDGKAKVMNIEDELDLYDNNIELETGVYKISGTDDNGEKIKIGVYIFEKTGREWLFLPGKFISDKNGDGIEFLLGREISGFYSFNANFNVKDFADKHNLTDYHDEYEKLYPYYISQYIETEEGHSEVPHSEAPDFSDSDGDAYVEEFLTPKYVDEASLPERMQPNCHIAKVNYLEGNDYEDILNISEDLPENVKAAINILAKNIDATSYRYIADFYNEEGFERYYIDEYWYLFQVGDWYYYCMDFTGDGAQVLAVSNKNSISEIFGVTIP